MSELDVDIRAVSGASFGARSAVTDGNQTPAADPSGLTSQSMNGNDNQSASADGAGAPVAVAQPTFRYDSFRFIYRTDYGRIVLVDQDPETGKPISQIPSQRALQLYAEQNRTEQHPAANSAVVTTASAGTGAVSGRSGLATPQLGKSSGLASSGSVGSTPSVPTPTTPQALQTPSPAFIAPSSLPVNITI